MEEKRIEVTENEELLNEEDLKKYFRPLNSLDVEDSEIIIVIKD